MKIIPVNHIGRHSRIDNKRLKLVNVHVGQGAQILRFPKGSVIRNIRLGGGASHKSRWAVLRGAVLKLGPNRTNPVVLDGKGLEVPSGHTLMDFEGFVFTRDVRNNGNDIPHEVIDRICSERFYLVHASYCHPDQLFIPQGTYTRTEFREGNILSQHGTLHLDENLMPQSGSVNVLDSFSEKPARIVIRLKDGGRIVLTDK